MYKKLLPKFFAATMTFFLISASADETKGAKAVESGSDTDQQDISIMNQPVDFSSPEAVEKTLQNVRKSEGDKAYQMLKNKMQYMLVYDLSLSNNKEKLYEKLDGLTPKEIMAKKR